MAGVPLNRPIYQDEEGRHRKIIQEERGKKFQEDEGGIRRAKFRH